MITTRSFAAVLAGLATTYAGWAEAHTSAIGFANAGPGSVTFWYGTYHGVNEATFTEGSLRLTNTDGLDVTTGFTLLSTTHPDGLVDDNTIYANGYDASIIAVWQGVTFASLTAGAYTFTYLPASSPTSVWEPLPGLGLTQTVTITTEDLGSTAITTDTDETSPELQNETIQFSGGTFRPTTPFTDARAVTIDANNGTVDTTNADVALQGEVSGDGGLNVTGGRTLTLTGTNSFAGGTTVTGSTLAINGNAALGTGPLRLDGGTLSALNDLALTTPITLTGSDTIAAGGSTIVLAGTVDGAGGLTKTGSGTLYLDGANSYSGATVVEAGRLSVNGSLVNSSVDVRSGASLGGNGTVGSFIVRNGAKATPGNSIGNLSVAGTATFEVGSTYEVEVDAAGNSDHVDVGGTAFIEGGTLAFSPAPGTYRLATTYDVLTAASGIVGTFDDATSSLAFLTPNVTYTANNVYATLIRNDISFASLALTRNQAQAGAATESLGFGDPVYDAVIGLDTAAVPAAFDSLSGEIHAASRVMALEDSHFVRDAVLDRARLGADGHAADGDPAAEQASILGTSLTVWSRSFGSWAGANGDGEAADLDRSTGGTFLGVDAPLGQAWRLGVAGGYTFTDFDLDDVDSKGRSENYHLAVYAGSHYGPVGLRLGGAYTWQNMDTNRKIDFAGFDQRAQAHPDARTGQIFGEAGYGLAAGPVALEPFGGLAYVHVDSDSFKESGSDAALKGRSDNADLAYSTLGLRGSADLPGSGSMRFSTSGMLGWRHAYGDTSPEASLSYVAGGSSFAVQSAPVARDTAVIEAGLALTFNKVLSLGVDYQGQLAHDFQDHGVIGNLTIRF